jgi:hypothetical protein
LTPTDPRVRGNLFDYKMNHFAIKEKIYIEALKVAYQKVGELEGV